MTILGEMGPLGNMKGGARRANGADESVPVHRRRAARALADTAVSR